MYNLFACLQDIKCWMDLSFLQLNNVFWSHSCVFWHCQAARPLSATIRDCVRNLGVVFDPTLPFYIVFDLFLHCQGDQCCCEKQFFRGSCMKCRIPIVIVKIFRGSCTKCRIPIVIVRIFFIRGSCMKCRIPIVIVRIFIIRGSCTKCRIPIVIVKIFIIFIIPLLP